jgi:hypothetical protein
MRDETTYVELIAAYLHGGFLVDAMSLDDWNGGRRFSRLLRDKRGYNERRLWSVPESIAQEIRSLVPQSEPNSQAWNAAKAVQMYLVEINPQ